MRKAAIIILTLIAIISCTSSPVQSRVIFISVAIDYSAVHGAGKLTTPPEDQRVLSEQIRTLAEASGEVYESYLFLEKDGTRTVNGRTDDWNQNNILETIADLDTVSGDLIIFHFSGHGDEDGAIATDQSILYTLNPQTLLGALGEKDGNKCLFIDSCYSGAFIEDGYPMSDGEVFEDGNLVFSSFVSALIPSLRISFGASPAGNDGIWVFSAAADDQLSFDSWDENRPKQDELGAFTYYLASALGYDMDMDRPVTPVGGEITFYGIYQEVKRTMASGLWIEATPQVTLYPLDLVLFSF